MTALCARSSALCVVVAAHLFARMLEPRLGEKQPLPAQDLTCTLRLLVVALETGQAKHLLASEHAREWWRWWGGGVGWRVLETGQAKRLLASEHARERWRWGAR